MRKRTSMRALGAGVATMLAVAMAATAQAKTDVSMGEEPFELFFYENVVMPVDGTDRDLFLITASSATAWCEEVPVMATLKERAKGSFPEPGSSIDQSFVERTPIALYDTGGLDAYVFLDEVYCAAYFDDGTEMEPLGTGMGTLWMNLAAEGGDGSMSVVTENGVRGSVWTDEGRLVVEAYAHITLEPAFSVDTVYVKVRNS